ncbi:myb/SANT-like DNA-binding domain-containing protein 3 [Periplaneta americana]|uniref:myb/SANT-like DNA-binding domain-containing protein 3 n=1 Tax=Periplaneta americana TaxID=6978 RepID=UPI0037E8C88A
MEVSHKMFTAEEKTILINLITTKRVIEDKRTDVETLAKKKAAWVEIEQEFNSNFEVSKRTLAQLKKCWDNIKTKRKKDMTRDSINRPKLTPVSASEILAGSSTQDTDNSCTDVCMGSDTPTTTQEAAQNRPLASSSKQSSYSIPRQRIVEEELEARLKRHKLQMEYDAKLHSLRENELQLLIDDAKQKLENAKKEEERRELGFQCEEERKELAFQWEEERKKQAFEAEQRRKEELHTLQLALLRNKSVE